MPQPKKTKKVTELPKEKVLLRFYSPEPMDRDFRLGKIEEKLQALTADRAGLRMLTQEETKQEQEKLAAACNAANQGMFAGNNTCAQAHCTTSPMGLIDAADSVFLRIRSIAVRVGQISDALVLRGPRDYNDALEVPQSKDLGQY